jgi:hypothetical protein
MRVLVVILGIVLLVIIEILRVYFIMPFPGSQRNETIEIAYFIGNNIFWFRLTGLVLIAFPLFKIFEAGSKKHKLVIGSLILIYGVVFYLFNFRFLADKMFLMPQTTAFLKADKNKIPTKQLIVGVTINGISKAYPIEIIGYHHQVKDTVSGQPILVTYCTVCRTGRVFSPIINGKPETFRLVGMDHFNAMFEDSETKSWWRQVNGEAIIGPLKGKSLDEIPSEQMSLSSWIDHHPDTWIMQPDSLFKEKYDQMKNYDEGKSKGDLTKHDSLSWNEKSWIVGVQIGMDSRAYDWNDLQKAKIINDKIDSKLIAVVIEPDSVSFHAFNRVLGTDTLTFSLSDSSKYMMDTKTNSMWSWNGACVSGPLQGKKLETIQSYQEYWHSWQTFRPQTTKYNLTN